MDGQAVEKLDSLAVLIDHLKISFHLNSNQNFHLHTLPPLFCLISDTSLMANQGFPFICRSHKTTHSISGPVTDCLKCHD